MAQIAIIVPGNLMFFPYLENYRHILDGEGIKYHIIAWDKTGEGESADFVFKRKMETTASLPVKVCAYNAFAAYVKKLVSENKYPKLLFLTPLAMLFMYSFLKRNYVGKFWLDYRDMSFELKVKWHFDRIARLAGGISVSSPAYIPLMPKPAVLFHNLDVVGLQNSLTTELAPKQADNEKIVVSNIGYIRHTCQQLEMIKALGNQSGVELRFCGDGETETLDAIKSYVAKNGISNVKFSGRYNKKEEAELYRQSDFVNIYLPKNIALQSAMANRFYQAILCGCKVIVDDSSVQAQYVSGTDLGICIKNCDKLYESILAANSAPNYARHRSELLTRLATDQEAFVRQFLRWQANEK